MDGKQGLLKKIWQSVRQSLIKKTKFTLPDGTVIVYPGVMEKEFKRAALTFFQVGNPAIGDATDEDIDEAKFKTTRLNLSPAQAAGLIAVGFLACAML